MRAATDDVATLARMWLFRRRDRNLFQLPQAVGLLLRGVDRGDVAVGDLIRSP